MAKIDGAKIRGAEKSEVDQRGPRLCKRCVAGGFIVLILAIVGAIIVAKWIWSFILPIS